MEDDMTKEQMAAFMQKLKAQLEAGEIDRAEFEKRREPIKERMKELLFG
jgi:hypothetical protein